MQLYVVVHSYLIIYYCLVSYLSNNISNICFTLKYHQYSNRNFCSSTSKFLFYIFSRHLSFNISFFTIYIFSCKVISFTYLLLKTLFSLYILFFFLLVTSIPILFILSSICNIYIHTLY